MVTVIARSECAPRPRDNDLVRLVEYLDSVSLQIALPYSPFNVPQILNSPNPMAHVFWIPVHELGRICGAHEILLESCTIPVPLKIGPLLDPGCAQEWILNGVKVHVKRVRIDSHKGPRRAKKVYQRLRRISDSSVLTKSTGFLPISCDGETLKPPKYCPSSGCHY